MSSRYSLALLPGKCDLPCSPERYTLFSGIFSEYPHYTYTITVLRLRCTGDDVEEEVLFKFDLLVDFSLRGGRGQVPEVMHNSERYAVAIPAGTQDSCLVFDKQTCVYRIFVGFDLHSYPFEFNI